MDPDVGVYPIQIFDYAPQIPIKILDSRIKITVPFNYSAGD